MSIYAENDGQFPDDSEVEVRFPLPGTPVPTERENWPWVRGHVLGQCGPDEWHIVVDGVDELAEPNLDGPDGEPLYPACFRDSTELRRTEPES